MPGGRNKIVCGPDTVIDVDFFGLKWICRQVSVDEPSHCPAGMGGIIMGCPAEVGPLPTNAPGITA